MKSLLVQKYTSAYLLYTVQQVELLFTYSLHTYPKVTWTSKTFSENIYLIESAQELGHQ